jgi:hypothetical protein
LKTTWRPTREIVISMTLALALALALARAKVWGKTSRFRF